MRPASGHQWIGIECGTGRWGCGSVRGKQAQSPERAADGGQKSGHKRAEQTETTRGPSSQARWDRGPAGSERGVRAWQRVMWFHWLGLCCMLDQEWAIECTGWAACQQPQLDLGFSSPRRPSAKPELSASGAPNMAGSASTDSAIFSQIIETNRSNTCTRTHTYPNNANTVQGKRKIIGKAGQL